MTGLAFGDLSQQWLRPPAPIAGLTARGRPFCLERLAWDHGMRVVFRADHRFEVLQTVSGSSPAMDTVDSLELASPSWAHHLARAVTSDEDIARYRDAYAPLWGSQTSGWFLRSWHQARPNRCRRSLEPRPIYGSSVSDLERQAAG